MRHYLFVLAGCAVAWAQPRVTMVVNAASQVPPGIPNYALAPNTLVRITGSGLGPTEPLSLHLFERLPLSLAGTSVRVRVGAVELDAPVLSAEAGAVYALIPDLTPLGQGTLTVSFGGQVSAPSHAFPVIAQALAFFTLNGLGYGPGLALDQGFQLVTRFNPVRAGPLYLLGTGFGRLSGGAGGPGRTTEHEGLRTQLRVYSPDAVDLQALLVPLSLAQVPSIAVWRPDGDCSWRTLRGVNSPEMHIPFSLRSECLPPNSGLTLEDLRRIRDLRNVTLFELFRDFGTGPGGSFDVIGGRVSMLPMENYLMMETQEPGMTQHASWPGQAPPRDPVFFGRQVNYGPATLQLPFGTMPLNFNAQFNQYSANLTAAQHGGGAASCIFAGMNKTFRFTMPTVPDAPPVVGFVTPGLTPQGLTLNFRRSSQVSTFVSVQLTAFNRLTNVTGRVTKVFAPTETMLRLGPDDMPFVPLSCGETANVQVIEGAALPMRIEASDDVGVARVRLTNTVQVPVANDGRACQ